MVTPAGGAEAVRAVPRAMGGRSPSPSSSGVATPPADPRSSGRHAPRQRLESGDPSSAEIAKKSWAESLRPTHTLYPSDFRGVTPALDRPSRKGRRAPLLTEARIH